MVKGWVENVEFIMLSVKVLIVFLWFGVGIKGKLIDVICCVIFSIIMWVGVEGIILISLIIVNSNI